MSKAQIPKNQTDKQIKDSRNLKKIQGMIRQTHSGGGSPITSVLGASSPSVSASVGGVATLKTAGDTMMGPIAFSTKTVVIADNTINIGPTASYSSHVIVTGVNNTINTISGTAFQGQILFLEGTSTRTYTIGTTGNITTLTGSAMTLTNTNVMVFIYDITQAPAGRWQMVTSGSSSGGGVSNWSDITINTTKNMGGYGLTNLGSIISTANDTYDLGSGSGNWNQLFVNSIRLQNDGPDAESTAYQIYKRAGSIKYDVPTASYHEFNVGQLPRFSVSSTGTFTVGHHALTGMLTVEDALYANSAYTTIVSAETTIDSTVTTIDSTFINIGTTFTAIPANSHRVTFNSYINSDLIPADPLQDLGNSSYPWNTLRVMAIKCAITSSFNINTAGEGVNESLNLVNNSTNSGGSINLSTGNNGQISLVSGEVVFGNSASDQTATSFIPFTFNSIVKFSKRNISTTTSLTDNNPSSSSASIIRLHGTSTFTVTLPDATLVTGLMYIFWKETGTGTVTIDGYASQTINGSANVALTSAYSVLRIISNGTLWMQI